jgi:hypothetical protein
MRTITWNISDTKEGRILTYKMDQRKKEDGEGGGGNPSAGMDVFL